MDAKVLDAILPCTHREAAKAAIARIAHGLQCDTEEAHIATNNDPIWRRFWGLCIQGGLFKAVVDRQYQPTTDQPTWGEEQVIAYAYPCHGPNKPDECKAAPSIPYVAQLLNRPVEWVQRWWGTKGTIARLRSGNEGFGL
jgi:hypothetical protein